jgi:hypothetical protein
MPGLLLRALRRCATLVASHSVYDVSRPWQGFHAFYLLCAGADDELCERCATRVGTVFLRRLERWSGLP